MSNFVRDFILMTKPRVWTFLLITGIAGEVFSLSILRSPNLIGFVYVALYIAIGLMGSESLSNYIDLDIDKKMDRTKDRPLPSGKMSPKVALIGGLILIAVTLILSYRQNILSFIFMATGIIDYDVVYALLSKRRTPWNIILGAYSGGAPLLAGFYAFTFKFNPVIILWFFIIFAWTPLHIWSLAIRYRKDYRDASVPMLPVVYDTKKTMQVLFPVSVLTSIFTILAGIYFMKYFQIYLGIAVMILYVFMAIYLMIGYLRAYLDPEKSIMKLFVSTNMFVGFFFLSVAIFSFLIPMT